MSAWLVGLGLSCLATSGAQALSYRLDLGLFPSPGSRVVPVNQVTPTPYTEGTRFRVTFNTGEPMDGSIATLHDFALPQPTQPLDIDFKSVNLTLGLSDLDVGAGVVPDTAATIELLGVVSDAGGGFFDLTFQEFTIFWAGDSGIAGSFPFVLSTLPTTISTNSGPTEDLYVVQGTVPIDTLPQKCLGGTPGGFDFPVTPNPTNLAPGSRLTLGGATCPSGLTFLSNLEPRPFSIELTGVLQAPEPGTFVLVSLGTVGLAVAGRRRRVG